MMPTTPTITTLASPLFTKPPATPTPFLTLPPTENLSIFKKTALPTLHRLSMALAGSSFIVPKAFAGNPLDSADTGISSNIAEGLTTAETQAPGVVSSAGEFLSNQWPGFVGAAIFTGLTFVGFRQIDKLNQKFQSTPRRNTFQKIIADGVAAGTKTAGVSASLVGAAYLFGWNIFTLPSIQESLTAVETGIVTHVGQLAGTVLLGAAIYGLNRNLTSRNNEIQKNTEISDQEKNDIQTWFTIGRMGSAALGVSAAAAIWGVSFGEMFTAFGFVTAGMTLAMRETLANVVGWMTIFANKKFKVGDEVTVSGVSGYVRQITPTDIVIEGVDSAFDEVVYHIPSSNATSTPVTSLTRHEHLIKQLKKGQWITIGDKTGQIEEISKHVLRIHTPQLAGGFVITNFHLSDLNDLNFTNHGDNIPLPDGINLDDTVIINNSVTGVLKGFTPTTYTLEIISEIEGSDGKNEKKKIPYIVTRSSISNISPLGKL